MSLQSKEQLEDTLKDQKSTVMEKYTSEYKEEEQLNQLFQDHVNCCRKTHEANDSSGNGLLLVLYVYFVAHLP